MKIASLQQIKKSVVLTTGVALCALFMSSSLEAQSLQSNQTKKGCEYRTLSMKITSNVQLGEVLAQLSDMCDFTVVYTDTPALDMSNQSLHGTNIKDKSLFDIFDILISSNNLNYDYKNSVLKVSAIATKSFKIDYITSSRQGTATMSASVNSAPREVGETGEINNLDRSDNQIVVKEEFDFWSTVDAEVQAILNTGKETYVAKPPIINPKAGLVTITATKEQLTRAEEYFKTLQQRLAKQVLIDVTILSVDLNDDNRFGIDWSKFQLGFFSESIANIGGINSGATWATPMGSNQPNGGYHLNLGNNPTDTGFTMSGGNSGSIGSNRMGKLLAFDAGVQFSLDGVFDFLKEKGTTNVISNPKILTLNNQQALITVGDTINYQTRSTTTVATTAGTTSEDITNYSLFVGILLNILPTVSDNNSIMLRINPSLSDFKYTEDNRRQADPTTGRAIPREIAPDTIEKKLSTVVSVKSGDTIILGGLITNSVAYEDKGVPLLRSIPILGYAFKYSGEVTKTKELVFIITPRIIGEDTTPISPKSLKDLGYKILEK